MSAMRPLDLTRNYILSFPISFLDPIPGCKGHQAVILDSWLVFKNFSPSQEPAHPLSWQ